MYDVQWEACQLSAGEKCVLHRVSKDSSNDLCESCQRLKVGASALCSDTTLGFMLEMPDTRQIFELSISAFVHPFMAKQTDTEPQSDP